MRKEKITMKPVSIARSGRNKQVVAGNVYLISGMLIRNRGNRKCIYNEI
jgi:hypothetical protein